MLTQSEIKKWCGAALYIFKNFMPDVYDIPEVHIVTDKLIIKKRSEIAKRLKAPERAISLRDYDVLMEMVHGECGDAIIIKQTSVNNLLKTIPEYEKLRSFCLFFWHELGHFYAIKKEKDDLHRFNDAVFSEDDFESNLKQEGYWFWSEFIAQCIAYHVDFMNCSVNNKEKYHPENIEWDDNVHEFISSKLLGYLELAFEEDLFSINSSALAMYYAIIFKDDLTQRYLKASEDGKPLDDEDIIELTVITKVDPAYHDALLKLYRILEKQMSKENFWETNEYFLYDVGDLITELSDNYDFNAEIDFDEFKED